MSTQVVPTFEQELTKQGKTTTPWYRFFQGLYRGIPPSAEVKVTLTQSPFTYTTNQRGFLIIAGGTVSLVQLSRGGITNYATGVTSGVFPLSAGDSAVITYSVKPDVTFFPQ
jgi:hypothetical protein